MFDFYHIGILIKGRSTKAIISGGSRREETNFFRISKSFSRNSCVCLFTYKLRIYCVPQKMIMRRRWGGVGWKRKRALGNLVKQSCNESMLAGSKVLDFVDISKKQLKKRFAVAARRVRVCVGASCSRA